MVSQKLLIENKKLLRNLYICSKFYYSWLWEDFPLNDFGRVLFIGFDSANDPLQKAEHHINKHISEIIGINRK